MTDEPKTIRTSTVAKLAEGLSEVLADLNQDREGADFRTMMKALAINDRSNLYKIRRIVEFAQSQALLMPAVRSGEIPVVEMPR